MAVSEHGAKIAASRLGVSVEEYRKREERGERFCPICRSWEPAAAGQGYCRPCRLAYLRGRRLGGITRVGIDNAAETLRRRLGTRGG